MRKDLDASKVSVKFPLVPTYFRNQARTKSYFLQFTAKVHPIWSLDDMTIDKQKLMFITKDFVGKLLKKSYHQWPARWAHLFTLAVRSPLHAKPTRWEMWKLEMRALTIILAQALGLCMFKPPFSSRAYKFGNSSQIEGGRIRQSSQSNHNHLL